MCPPFLPTHRMKNDNKVNTVRTKALLVRLKLMKSNQFVTKSQILCRCMFTILFNSKWNSASSYIWIRHGNSTSTTHKIQNYNMQSLLGTIFQQSELWTKENTNKQFEEWISKTRCLFSVKLRQHCGRCLFSRFELSWHHHDKRWNESEKNGHRFWLLSKRNAMKYGSYTCASHEFQYEINVIKLP